MFYTKNIISNLKQKHPSFSEEQLKLILDSFYDGFRYYCTNPLDTKSGILVNELFSIKMSKKKIIKYIEVVKLKTETLDENNINKSNHRSSEFYEELLTNITKHERQTKK